METYPHDISDPKPQPQPDSSKSVGALGAELSRLFLLLLWAICKRLIRITYKAIRFSVKFVRLCINSVVEWWRDKSTQEKVRYIRLKARRWCKLVWKYTCVGSRQLWRGLIICCKATVRYTKIAAKLTWVGLLWLGANTLRLLIHTKPALISLGKWLKATYRKAIARMKRIKRAIRLRQLRGHRKYQTFKRNGGIKGAMENASRALKSSIQSYMEEEQNEANPEAITEDDIFEERFEEIEQTNRAHAIGKKIFSSVKHIVDTNE